MVATIPQLKAFHPSQQPVPVPHVPVLDQHCGPYLPPQFSMSIPPLGTNPQSFGMQSDPVETTEACGESRSDHDDPTPPSSEKDTRMRQSHVDEKCVSDEEPKGGDIVADDTMDDAEKMQSDSETENVGLQDDSEKDQEAENEVAEIECSKEVDNGPMTYTSKPENPPKPVKSFRPNSSVSNDGRKLSACECKKKIQPFEKSIIVVKGTTYWVTKGKEEKYGFQKMR